MVSPVNRKKRNLFIDTRGTSMATEIRFSLILFLISCTFFVSAQFSRKELEGHQIDRRSGRTDYLDPSRSTPVAWRPRVFLYQKFLSDEECDHLISLRNTSEADADSEEMNLEDEVIRRIDERVSVWTFIPKENGRPLQILKLDGKESKQNNFNFGQEFITMASEPLMATVVVFLSTSSPGGLIRFPKSENVALSDCRSSSIALNSTRGNAVVFFHAHLNGSLDDSSYHARCPLSGDETWYAIKLYHVRAFRGDKADDCTDEDENCLSWAASGECQRNPLFMLGSPDYYGTCRKSCNACETY